MASHPHHYHQDIHAPRCFRRRCCCCCYRSCCSSACPCASPSPTSAAASATPNILIEALAAHLLQSTGHDSLGVQSHLHHLPSPCLSLPQRQENEVAEQTSLLSLIRRVSALESALSLLSPSPPPPAPQQKAHRPPAVASSRPSSISPAIRKQDPPKLPSYQISLRNIAARTIQTQFRLYLVRRSKTLRHLKDLATLRSHLTTLNSHMSTGADCHRLSPRSTAISQRSMDLLLQLDSIQNKDPLIREGKRSISRGLVEILEFIDGISSKRPELSLSPMTIFEGGSGSEVDHIGRLRGAVNGSSRRARRVCFAESRDGSQSSNGTQEATLEGEEEDQGLAFWTGGSSVLQEDNDEHLEPDGSYCHGSTGRDLMIGKKLSSDMGLCAPLPVKMEPRSE